MEVLSQKEIDQLLKAISEGSKDEPTPMSRSRKIKIYDFKRPDKISKEALRNVCKLSENYVKDISRLLSIQQNTSVVMHVASVDQLTYEEFLRSIPSPTEVSVISIGNYKCAFEVDPILAFTLLDVNQKEYGKLKNRDLTVEEIKKWNTTFIRPMLKSLENTLAGKTLVPYEKGCLQKRKVRNIKFENNPQFMYCMKPEEMVCLITIEMKYKDEEGMMNICMPHKLASELSEELMGKVTEKPKVKSVNPEMLNNTLLPIEVRLGTTKKSIKDILGMKEGTIIELDKLAGEPVDILANGKLIAQGEVVVIDENFGVRLVELVENE